MSESPSGNKLFLREKDISNIIGCFELINHLTNEEKFLKFKKEYFSDWDDNDIIQSYIWLIASIYDHFCELIISMNPFFDQLYDIKLTRGYYFNVHYSEFCSNFIQGKLVYFIYNYLENKIFNIYTLKDLFISLKDILEQIYPLYSFLKELKLDYFRKHVFFIIENLLWPVSGPNVKTKDFFFIQSHFFKNIIEYLNFFKKDDGTWISSKGFFLGIAFALSYIIGDNFIKNNKNLKELKDLPFKDFSMEENGLLFKFSLSSNQTKYDVNDKIHLYSTKEGDLPLYELVSSNIKKYREKISDLYNEIQEKLPEEKNRISGDLNSVINLISNAIYGTFESKFVEIPRENIRMIIVYLDKFPKFQEQLTIANIFDFEDVYSISSLNKTHNNAFFKILSTGILSFLNDKKWKDSFRIVVFHYIIQNSKGIIKNLKIESIGQDSSIYFLNNPFDINENLLFGVYLEVPTGSEIKKDQTFWIGSPLYGNNKKFPTLNLQNFQELTKFYEAYKSKLEIKSFLLNEKAFNIIYKNPKLNFEQPSPFNYIFESGKEIQDHIKLNNYKKVYEEFVKTYTEEKVSSNLKGKILEDLAEKLFNIIPGFRVVGTNIKTEAEEIDLVVEINSKIMDVLEMLGSIFLVECKNWKVRVGAPEISSFMEKLSIKNLKGGIIISRLGISGRKQDSDARQKIRDAVNRGQNILVIGMDELEKISNGINPLFFFRKSYYNIYFKGLLKSPNI